MSESILTNLSASAPEADASALVSGPRALVACRQWGVSSEVWIARQIAGFRRVRPEVLCWEGGPGASDTSGNAVRVRMARFDPQPSEGPGRWLLRLRNAATANYYGAVGRELRALHAMIREAGAEVVLCHFGHTALRVLPAATRAGVPVVAHFHGVDVSSGLRNRWYRTSLLRHLDRFAAIVVVGSHQRRWMLDQGVKPEKVHLIPCGVPTEFFKPSPRIQPRAGLQIVAVSRLVAWKGVAESIQALALVRRQGIDAELRIIGDGPQRAELEKLAATVGVDRQVHFFGARNEAAVREILAESDVFVQHSLTSPTGWCEGFGVSVAEAAAMQLPIVATRSGGIPDQVIDGETGVLVPERDVAAMAAAICRLAREPALRTRLGTVARDRMVAHFDSARQIAKLEAVMLEAIQGGTGQDRRMAGTGASSR